MTPGGSAMTPRRADRFSTTCAGALVSIEDCVIAMDKAKTQLALIAALVLASCSLPVIPRADQGVAGALSVAGPSLGERRIEPARCASGQLQSFLGADFVDPRSQLVARLAIEPLAGPGVRIFSAAEPFGAAIVVRPGDCEVFHFAHERNGWQLNDVYVTRIELELRCALANGDRIEGKVSAPACS